jgi:hypothetical protein
MAHATMLDFWLFRNILCDLPSLFVLIFFISETIMLHSRLNVAVFYVLFFHEAQVTTTNALLAHGGVQYGSPDYLL